MAEEFKNRNTLIIVPTYCEKGNIKPLLDDVFKHQPDVDVLFVDDNSNDGTRNEITEYAQEKSGHIFLLARPGKLGLGTAYIDGMNWALERHYQVVIEMDADGSHNPAYLSDMIKHLKSNEVVIGSRYVEGGGTENWGFIRKCISRFGSLYARTILGMNIQDLTGGFNVWKRQVLLEIDLDSIKSEGYSFQIEMKYRAFLTGFSLTESPIIFTERREGQSKMSGKIVLEAVYRVLGLRIKKNLLVQRPLQRDPSLRSG